MEDVGYTDCATSGCGDGACCATGYKKYCCRGGCPNLHGLHELKYDSPPKIEEEVVVPGESILIAISQRHVD